MLPMTCPNRSVSMKCLLLASLLLIALPAIARDVPMEVTGSGGVKLAGTLALPDKPGKAPALLLIQGSGPTDRDGNQNAQLHSNVLKQVADALAADGIASL